VPQDRAARVLVIAETPPARYGDDRGWQQALAATEKQWFAPLLADLRQGKIEEIALVALHTRASLRFEVGRTDLHKFWRGRRPLYTHAPGAG
jgi:hypothetical protein